MTAFKLGYPPRDMLPYAACFFWETTAKWIHSFRGRRLAQWWNIELGSGCIFTGMPIFRKHPTGKIVIGREAVFRSAEWSNSIGLNRRCFISAGKDAKVHIGNQCGFSATIISASEFISIGDRVICGANCTICDGDFHPLDAEARIRNERGKTSPVYIEEDVFLGMNVVVLKGTHIGKNTVVAANSVVVGPLPENVVAGGIPAVVLRKV